MSIHIFNQSNPDGPVDGDRLQEEFVAGLELMMDVPLTRTHLTCLCAAAQRLMQQPDCPPAVADVLLDFVQFCARQADFGPETRKLLTPRNKIASLIQPSTPPTQSA